ncbi:unnamed protein product [Cylicostephanus goldi]|uniref:Uncharacterized protein n=1 Tax=Cylicostephanus goldi TaxID=71465 RepID=A0A3P6R680_CYLGO|nr:unnamed protein product [Cylicostephanus goldi]
MIDYAISELERNTEMEAAEAVRQMKEELRATKHALWMARALRANAVCEYYSILAHFNNLFSEEERLWLKWSWVYRKCREKAEEFK